MLGGRRKSNADQTRAKKGQKTSPVAAIGYIRKSESYNCSTDGRYGQFLSFHPAEDRWMSSDPGGRSDSDAGRTSDASGPQSSGNLSSETATSFTFSDRATTDSNSSLSRRYVSGRTGSSPSIASNRQDFLVFGRGKNSESSMSYGLGDQTNTSPGRPPPLKQTHSLHSFSMEGSDSSESPSGISSTISEPTLCRNSPDGTPTKHDPALFCSDGLIYARRARAITLGGDNERQVRGQIDIDEDEDFSKYIEDDDYVGLPRAAAVGSGAVQRRVNRKKAKNKYHRSYERQADGTAVLIANNKSIKDKLLGFFGGKGTPKLSTRQHDRPQKQSSRAERTHYKKSPHSPGPTIHSFTFSDTKIGGADLAVRHYGKPSAVTMGVWPPQHLPEYHSQRRLTSSSINSEVAFKRNELSPRDDNEIDAELIIEDKSSENPPKSFSDSSLPPFTNRDGSMLSLGVSPSSPVKRNGILSPNAFLVDGQGEVKLEGRDWKSQSFDLW